MVKYKTLLMVISFILVSCGKNPMSSVNIKKKMSFNEIGQNSSIEIKRANYIKVLEEFTIDLSLRVKKNNSIIENFKLTDAGNNRKLPVRIAVSKLGLEREFQKIKSHFQNKEFVLIMWDKWYKKWKNGKIDPYFAFDPLEDESKIKTVNLYRNGKIVKKINIKDFDNYPVVVLSPEWWEGDTLVLTPCSEDMGHGIKKDKSYYLIPFIDGLYISRCFDPYFWGSCGAMEIYVVTWNDSNINTRDTTDFPEVDYPNRWYLPTCNDISCNFLEGFHRRVFYHPVTSDTFYIKIMERDGGLRFNDDFVGFYMEHRYGGPHYIPGSASRIWIYIDLPYKN